MSTNPRYSQYGGASSPSRGTGVYTGKITLIYDDGRVRVFINTFGRNIGPCRIINKSAGDAITLNDEVLCTYANDTSDELIVVGRLTERVDPVSESTSGLIVEASTTSALVRITQKGTGSALLVEDSTNPDSTPFIIDTSGNVGIGVSSPTAKIDVSGAAVISGDLTVDTTTLKVDSSNNRVGIGTASPSVTLDISGATSVSGDLTVDTTTLKVDSSNNRVGIGTVSPSTALQVVGTVTANAFAGALTGNVIGNVTGNITGNVSGTAATVTGAAQTAITSVGTLTGLTIGGAGSNRFITINAPTGYYAIQYFAINGTNKWHYELNPAGTRWSLVESGVAERIGVTSTGATFSGTVTATTFSGGLASSNLTGQTGMWTSAGRPGATRLYRNDYDDPYNVQTYYNNTNSRWRLYGYYNDSAHAGVEVAYADSAGTAGSATTAGTATNQSGGTVSASYLTVTGGEWLRTSGGGGWYNTTYARGINCVADDGYVKTYPGNGGSTSFSANYVYVNGRLYGPGSNSHPTIQMREGNGASWSWTGTYTMYVDVTAVKTFVIDHPIKQDNYLVHACAEGPTSDVFYRGTGQLQNGVAVIELPDYFESLTEEEGRTVMITPIADETGNVANLAAHEIYEGKFVVELAGGYVIKNQRFWWRVDAVRKNTSFAVEPEKSSVTVSGNGPYTYIQRT